MSLSPVLFLHPSGHHLSKAIVKIVTALGEPRWEESFPAGLVGGDRNFCWSTNWHFQALHIHIVITILQSHKSERKEVQVPTLFSAQIFKINYLLGLDHSLTPHTQSFILSSWPEAPLLTPLNLSITNDFHIIKSTGQWSILIFPDLSGTLRKGNHKSVWFSFHISGYSLSLFLVLPSLLYLNLYF